MALQLLEKIDWFNNIIQKQDLKKMRLPQNI
jgi:hypothetical protein